MSEFEIIAYTRKQAIADGVLIPIPVEIANQAGFVKGDMVLGQDMNAKVKAVAGVLRNIKSLSEEDCYSRSILSLLVAANDAIMSATDKNVNTITFTWHQTDCRISLSGNPKSGVEWTVFMPSDD